MKIPLAVVICISIVFAGAAYRPAGSPYLISPGPALRINAEICDNALDDDGDGLVDLNDPDCDCPEVEPISLIPNPSFEEQECCPSSRSQMHCASTWIQASAPTTDYLHSCGWMGWPDLPPPLPFPDGEACLGFRNGRPGTNDGSGPQPNWKEYAGACLTGPLRAGVAYRFEFYVGYTYRFNSPPTTIVFYGTTDCTNLPFGEGDPAFGCPTNGPGWKRLGSVSIVGAQEWQLKEINVVPTENIYAIAIGPSCTEMPMNVSTYYFFDKLVLAEEREFAFQVTPEGHPCSDTFGLALPFRDTLQYQWYRDGIALVGETGHELQQVRKEGNYQVRLLGPNTCRITPTYRYQPPSRIQTVREVACQGEPFVFGGRELTASGLYYDTLKTVENCDSIIRLELEVAPREADTIYAKVFEGDSWRLGGRRYSEPGQYTALLTSSNGCDSLATLFLDTYDAYIPSAFSPNGDGRNDRFTVFAGEDILEVRRLQVFSRWGSLVYDSEGLPPNASGEGWDGRVEGRDAPSGLYVYQGIIVTIDGKEHHLSGEVVLVR